MRRISKKCKQNADNMQINFQQEDPKVLAELQQFMRTVSIYYSTKMAGNRLTFDEVEQTVKRFEAKQKKGS